MTQWKTDTLPPREAMTWEEIVEATSRIGYQPRAYVMGRKEYDWWLKHPELRKQVFGC